VRGRLITEFRVSLTPAAHDRPRFDSRGKKPRTYETSKNINFRRDFRQAVERYRPEVPFAGPIAIELVYWIKPPKKINLDERPFPGRPDIDNLQKGVLDALNPTYRRDKVTKARIVMYSGFWEDDSQIVAMDAQKFWATEHESPGILVAMYEA